MNRGIWGVLVAAVLAAALVVGLAGTCLGGAMYQNTSGEVARAVRVEFSEPAEITSMWPSFPQRDPPGPATVIVLSGGEVPAGGWFSFTWRPDTARVVKIEWFVSPPSSARPSLGFSDPIAKPEVHGELLNPAFFAHPAYVMQGVSDRDEVFALPLHGVPELALYPVLGDLPASSLTWKFEVSHPEGIGAAIEDGTLYIWGSNSEWQGYGEVELHVSTPDGRAGSVEIPVVVFCTDRTLVNPQGKKDYFVPWGVVLDINRILSTEEHMRQYNKPDLGLLDRTLRFSRWRQMEFMRDVTIRKWKNELVPGGPWPQSSQFTYVDVVLDELRSIGVDTIRFENIYYFTSRSCTELVPIYDRYSAAGPTRRAHEVAYVINEAHRIGISVLYYHHYHLDPAFSEGLYEMDDSTPDSVMVVFRLIETLELAILPSLVALGVDMVGLASWIEGIGPIAERDPALIDDTIIRIVTRGRNAFPGPITKICVYGAHFYPGGDILHARFWAHVDVLTAILVFRVDGRTGRVDSPPLTSFPNPTVEQLVEAWKGLIEKYFQPFQERYNKPFIAVENGCVALEGAANWGVTFLYWEKAPSSTTVSISDMRLHYLSQHLAFVSMDGYFGPGWYTYSFDPNFGGGVQDGYDFTPRLKVEDLIQELFLGRAVPRLIRVDGQRDDWLPAYLITSARSEGSSGAAGIAGVYFAADEQYLYFMIEFEALVTKRGFLTLEIAAGRGGHPGLFVQCDNVYTVSERWNGWLHTGYPEYTRVGTADVAVAGSSVELRFSRAFVERNLIWPPGRVRVTFHNTLGQVENATEWLSLPAL